SLGPGDLLGLEQRALPAAAIYDHAQERRGDPSMEEFGRREVEGTAGGGQGIWRAEAGPCLRWRQQQPARGFGAEASRQPIQAAHVEPGVGSPDDPRAGPAYLGS